MVQIHLHRESFVSVYGDEVSKIFERWKVTVHR